MQVQQGDMSPLRGSTFFRCSFLVTFLMLGNFKQIVTYTDPCTCETGECNRSESHADPDTPH